MSTLWEITCTSFVTVKHILSVPFLPTPLTVAWVKVWHSAGTHCLNYGRLQSANSSKKWDFRQSANFYNHLLSGIEVMAHNICAKNLRTYTLSRNTARAAGNKVQVSYIKIIWLTHPAEIKSTRVRFTSGDLSLIVCVLLAKQVTRVRFSFFDRVC